MRTSTGSPELESLEPSYFLVHVTSGFYHPELYNSKLEIFRKVMRDINTELQKRGYQIDHSEISVNKSPFLGPPFSWNYTYYRHGLLNVGKTVEDPERFEDSVREIVRIKSKGKIIPVVQVSAL